MCSRSTADAEQNTRISAAFYHNQTVTGFPFKHCSVFAYIGFDSSHYQSTSPKHVSVFLSAQGQMNRIFPLNFLSRLPCRLVESDLELELGAAVIIKHDAFTHQTVLPIHSAGGRKCASITRPSSCRSVMEMCTLFSAWKAPGFFFCAFQPLLKHLLMYQTRLYTLLAPSLLLLFGIVYCNANKDRK